VLALQGGFAAHGRMLRALGAEVREVRVPADLDGLDGLVIPGGESTTMWKLAETFELLEPLRMRIKAGMPAYGSCAGMIMLADRIEGGIAGQQTIGGIDMVVRRNAFGRQVDSFEADVDFAGRGGMRAVFIRAPWVESVGSGVEVLALAEPGDRIVAVRQGPLLATSFHPELTGDVGVHSYFAEMVREL
jgi:pyridoxal 5'-phosphate synthase pdxT subunit